MHCAGGPCRPHGVSMGSETGSRILGALCACWTRSPFGLSGLLSQLYCVQHSSAKSVASSARALCDRDGLVVHYRNKDLAGLIFINSGPSVSVT
jgi:hypothetical protein